jgi:hypothetical protein
MKSPQHMRVPLDQSRFASRPHTLLAYSKIILKIDFPQYFCFKLAQISDPSIRARQAPRRAAKTA